MKKSVLIVLLVLVSLSFLAVNADISLESLTPAGITWLSSSSAYEYNTQTVDIRINHPGSQLIQTNITTTGATINEVLSPSGCTVNSGVITCDGDFQILSVNITTSNVAADTAFNWDIVAADSQSGSVSKTLQLDIANDAVNPSYNLNTPVDSSIAKSGQLTFNITPIDQESGFVNTQFFYDYYNIVAESGITDRQDMSCTNNCISTASLVPPINKNYVGFYFNVSDNAGNQNLTKYYWLYVDNEAPSVTLNTPADSMATNVTNYNFQFVTSDKSFGIDARFTPAVSCGLYIDSIQRNSTTVSNNSTLNLGVSFTGIQDGTHSWYVTCVDTAGWSTTSATRTFLLDTNGPSFTLNSPANNAVIGQGWNVNFSVPDDLSSTHSVWYSLDGGANSPIAVSGSYYILNTSSWASGFRTLVVYANDSLGNNNQTTYTFTVDTINPTVTLISPSNNSYDNSYNFQFNVTDSNSSAFSCDLLIGGVIVKTSTVSAIPYTFSNSLADARYDWAVQCRDQAGNVGVSETRVVMVDTVAPIVTLNDPTNGNNYPTGVSLFNATSDSAGPACSIYVDKVLYSGSVTYSNSPHYWNTSCDDLAGNTGWSSTWTFYQDNITPVISSVSSSSITSTAATIAWNIDEQSNNMVYFGTSNVSLTLTTLGAITTTTPSINLASLISSTKYFYLVNSCDQWNQCSNSSVYNLTTTATSDGSSGGSGGSGGGGAAATSANKQPETLTEAMPCQPDWDCSEWSVCSNGRQVRACEDLNACGSSHSKPEESKSCIVSSTSEQQTNEAADSLAANAASDTGNNPGGLLTGAFTGVVQGIKDNTTIAILGAVLLLLGGLLTMAKGPAAFRKVIQIKDAHEQKHQETIQEKLRKQGIIK
ncbi:hypothetical protein J4444_00005 [Candidatus Woesearchaeota archaeon]|nr:hypothetical protein [Candidatus Woesearchaeota archaeon]